MKDRYMIGAFIVFLFIGFSIGVLVEKLRFNSYALDRLTHKVETYCKNYEELANELGIRVMGEEK